VLIEEGIGGRGVTVHVVVAVEHAQGDQGIEEVSAAAAVQPEFFGDSSFVLGSVASTVKTPSSTALRRVLDPQNAMPSCRIGSGLRS